MRNDFTAPNELPYDDAPLPEDDYYQQGNATGGNAFPPAPEQTAGGERKAGRGRPRKNVSTINPAAANVIVYEMTPASFKATVDRISNYFAENHLVYNQNGRLVRPVTIAEKTTFSFGMKKHKNNFMFDAGSTVIVPINEDDMYNLVRRHFILAKKDVRSGSLIEKDPPSNLIKALMVVRNDWPFPLLTVVTNCPCLRADGTILDKEGYDPQTGMFAYWQGAALPFVPTNPTKEDAERALKVLEAPLREFPFANGGEEGDPDKAEYMERLNKAVALSVFFTIVSRRAYQNAPMFPLDAHVQGTGKSTLATLFGIVATGREPACITVAKDDAEFEKGLFAFLLNGSPICLFDNVDRPLNSAMLNTVLTQSLVRARILGASKEGFVPTSSVYIATGNNMQIVGDLTRRTVPCQLDRNEERPSEHKFENPNMLKDAAENRLEIVAAALTILRAYHLAGHPKPKNFPAFGSFEDWSHWVRGAVVWLGFPDPINAQRRLEDEDPLKAAFASVLEAWSEAYGNEIQTISSIFKDFQNSQSVRKDLYDNLAEAFENAIPHRGELRPRHVGMWLEKQKGRFANGYQLVKAGREAQGVLWKVNPPKL